VPRTIKRYANRKLYDTSESCYITLDEIADLVKDGVEVEIVDNTSKEDLTAVTLAQILFEAEKRKKRMLPLATLRTLIQSGGELIEKSITRPVVKTRDDAVQKVTHFGEQTQKTWDDFQRQIEERVTGVVKSVSHLRPVQGDLDAIAARLDAIEARLSAMENGKRATNK